MTSFLILSSFSLQLLVEVFSIHLLLLQLCGLIQVSNRTFITLLLFFYYSPVSYDVIYTIMNEIVRYSICKSVGHKRVKLTISLFSWQLQFLQSEFRGQLPQPFSDLENGTMIIPENMNDANQEEITRYVSQSYLLLSTHK